jgi:hypothetical protein
MIGSSIDGSSSNQLFDLLKVVANPEVYSEKVKSLEDAIAENKKYVELVAPASEIIALREQLLADKAVMVQELEKVRSEAVQAREEAKAQAKIVVADANASAAKIKKSTADLNDTAKAKLLELEAATLEIKQRIVATESAEKAAKEQEAALILARNALEADTVAVKAKYEEWLARAKKLTEGL